MAGWQAGQDPGTRIVVVGALDKPLMPHRRSRLLQAALGLFRSRSIDRTAFAHMEGRLDASFGGHPLPMQKSNPIDV